VFSYAKAMFRGPEPAAVAGLLAAALTFAATCFAITCDYRDLYFPDLSALAGVRGGKVWRGEAVRRPGVLQPAAFLFDIARHSDNDDIADIGSNDRDAASRAALPVRA
jgi:hypothetical protein